MTIAERKAREAYDRENPWRQIATITDDIIGMICELRTSYHGMATDQENPSSTSSIGGPTIE